MLNFKDWIIEENKSELAYHVTLASYLPGIMSNGLIPNTSTSNFNGYNKHSENRNFFSSTIETAERWAELLRNNINKKHSSHAWDENNFVKQQAIPIIIKFIFNKTNQNNRWGNDEKGNIATKGGSYFTTRTIPPEGLLVWNGVKWIRDTVIDPAPFVDKKELDTFEMHYLKVSGQIKDLSKIPKELYFNWVWKEPYPKPI